MHDAAHQYPLPALPTYAQKRAEKERQLAIAAGQIVDSRADDQGGSKDNISRRTSARATDNASSHSQFIAAVSNQVARPLATSFSAGHVADTFVHNADLSKGTTEALTQSHVLREYRYTPSFHRPLPSPIKPTFNAPEAARPLPSPRLPGHPREGTHVSPVACARDRQRSLPQPTLKAVRTMPSVPALRFQAANAISALASGSLGSHESLSRNKEQSLGRQTSSPNLQSGFPRRLPRPPPVPPRDNSVYSSIDPSTSLVYLVSSPTLPAPPSTSTHPPSIAGMDRSDTVSSVKSLDRWELSQRTEPRDAAAASHFGDTRPLPTPRSSAAKSALAPSRSLDRGTPGHRESWKISDAGIGLSSEIRITTEAEPEEGKDDRQGPLSDVQDTAVPKMRAESALPTTVLSDTPTIPALVVTSGPSTMPAVESDAKGEAPIASRELRNPEIIVESSSAPSINVTTETHSALRAPIQCMPSENPSHKGPGISCAACNLAILGAIINAAGKRWHPDCLRCTTCGVGLEHVSRYDHDGMPYCHMDYHEQFAPKCHHCTTPIVDERYITIDDASLGQRFYHELHFFCGECGIPFLDPSRSSAAGTESRSNGNQRDPEKDDIDQTEAFVIHGGHAFCPECDIKLHGVKCKKCRLPIRKEDDGLKALGANWHKTCFKCAACHHPIPTQHFVPLKRKPYCQECYESSQCP
ncbi:hypothetical protein NliqN6_6477 [Naganishia liquefaciens]|uniref:LIM zinc-binding domain-containing protein n=1 Tax=Naganishia liquefaciens TaxID=104408 RepID=A0A8H3U070_9TREE|nr:hypothetical protein NliqN6_6477 [Naganishia liquefaciens]